MHDNLSRPFFAAKVVAPQTKSDTRVLQSAHVSLSVKMMFYYRSRWRVNEAKTSGRFCTCVHKSSKYIQDFSCCR